MNHLEWYAQHQLHQDVKREMVDAGVDKHVGYVSPCLEYSCHVRYASVMDKFRKILSLVSGCMIPLTILRKRNRTSVNNVN